MAFEKLRTDRLNKHMAAVHFPHIWARLDRLNGEDVGPKVIVTAVEGNQLVINRTLRLEKSFFPPQDCAQLKNLFGIVQAGHCSHAVLQFKQATVF
jgi:hypothetical protein